MLKFSVPMGWMKCMGLVQGPDPICRVSSQAWSSLIQAAGVRLWMQSSVLAWPHMPDLAVKWLCTNTIWHTKPCHLDIWGSPQIKKFDGKGMVAVLIDLSLGAINTATAPLLPNLWTSEESHRPDDMCWIHTMGWILSTIDISQSFQCLGPPLLL